MSRPIALALVALLAPAAAALLLALASPLRRRGGPAAAVTIAGSVASFAAAVMLLVDRLGGGPPELLTAPWLQSGSAVIAEVGVCADGVSASMLAVVTLVALCVQVFSLGYMHDELPPSFGRYFTYHALFLFSMNVLVLAPNLLQLFAGWELVGVTSYLLIGFYFRKPSAARAAVKAFWVTKFADMGLLFGLFVLFAASGSFRWDAHLAPAVATAVTLLLFLAVVGKSAQFPLHVWLPDAMEGPTPVSALLHAATMVAAGVFLVVRANPLFAQSETTRDVMLVVGSCTALFAACLALVQTDIKKVLAYSTCSQLGYMVAALGAGSMLGGFFHLTTHAFFKALLFLAAGSAIHAVHSNEIGDMGGLARKMPLTGAAFVIGALALAGIPGTSGFFSKDLVLEAVEPRLGHVPWVLLLGTAFLTAFYMGRVVVVAFLGKASGEKAEHAHEAGWSMRGPLVVLGALSLAGGAFTAPFARLHGEVYAFHVGVGPALAAALALGGFALAYMVYGGARDATPAPLAFIASIARTRAVNRVYEFGFHKVALVASDGLAWVDRYVVDGFINMIGYTTLEGGRRARPLQTGLAPDYVLAVVLGVVGLAAWAVARINDHLLALIVASPALAAVVVMLLPGGARLAIRLVSLLGAAVSLAGSVVALVTYDRARSGLQRVEDFAVVPSLGVHLRLAQDGWSGPLLLLTGVIIFAGVLASWTLAKRDKEYFVLLLVLVAGVFGVFVSQDLLMFFLFYEVAVLPMYLLIGIWGASHAVPGKGPFAIAWRAFAVGDKQYAAMKLTLMLLVGSAAIMAAIFVLYVKAGATSFDMAHLAATRYDRHTQIAVFPLIWLGFGTLAGVFPFHTWSPDGHASAPTAVSMLHAGVLMKLGAFGVMRVGMVLLPEGARVWVPVVGAVAAVNVLYGAFCAMSQKDLKYIVAYSSVSHMGVVMLGAATLTPAGWDGAVFQMVAHGIMTGLFFALVGIVYERAHTRAIARMGGFATVMPGVAVFFTLACLSSLGLPGTAGFVSEFVVFLSAWRSGHTLWTIAGVLGAFVTAIYVLRATRAIFWGPGPSADFHELTDARGTEWGALLLLGASLVVLGVWPRLLLDSMDVGTTFYITRLLPGGMP